MKKINYKVLFSGLLSVGANAFIFSRKLLHENYRVSSAVRADLMDGYFGFFLLFIFFILSLSVISYGLNLDIKLSKIGKFIVESFLRWNKKKTKVAKK